MTSEDQKVQKENQGVNKEDSKQVEVDYMPGKVNYR